MDISGYRYAGGETNCSHGYLMPAILELLRQRQGMSDRRLFDLGCGNGSIANLLTTQGLDVTGVDPSSEGIIQGKNSFPHITLETGSAYDDLAGRFGMVAIARRPAD